jgi:hypothetical protein
MKVTEIEELISTIDYDVRKAIDMDRATPKSDWRNFVTKEYQCDIEYKLYTLAGLALYAVESKNNKLADFLNGGAYDPDNPTWKTLMEMVKQTAVQPHCNVDQPQLESLKRNREPIDCPICLDTIIEKETITACCLQEVCYDCLQDCLSKANRCPLCRDTRCMAIKINKKRML